MTHRRKERGPLPHYCPTREAIRTQMRCTVSPVVFWFWTDPASAWDAPSEHDMWMHFTETVFDNTIEKITRMIEHGVASTDIVHPIPGFVLRLFRLLTQPPAPSPPDEPSTLVGLPHAARLVKGAALLKSGQATWPDILIIADDVCVARKTVLYESGFTEPTRKILQKITFCIDFDPFLRVVLSTNQFIDRPSFQEVREALAVNHYKYIANDLHKAWRSPSYNVRVL